MRVPQSAFFPGTSFANGAVCVLQRFPVWIFFFWTCLTRPSAPRVLLQVGVWSASGLGPGFLGVAGSRGAGVGGAFCLSFCWPQQPPEIGTVQVCSGVAQRREASLCPRPCLWPPSLKASSEQRCLPPEEEAAGAPPDAEQAVPGATGRGQSAATRPWRVPHWPQWDLGRLWAASSSTGWDGAGHCLSRMVSVEGGRPPKGLPQCAHCLIRVFNLQLPWLSWRHHGHMTCS